MKLMICRQMFKDSAIIYINDPLEIIEALTAGVTSFNLLLPTLAMSFAILKSIWSKANPDATFADFNAYLIRESAGVVSFGEAQMIAWGYVKNEEGNWIKA